MTKLKNPDIKDFLPRHSSVKQVIKLPPERSRFGNGMFRKVRVIYCHRGIDYQATIKVTKKVYQEI
jgi:hypothetical protein